MMIRVPMLSEVADVVRVTDISLNSEIAVLKALMRRPVLRTRSTRSY